MKGAWWWNEEVNEKVNGKKESYAAYLITRTDVEKEINRVKYKAPKK